MFNKLINVNEIDGNNGFVIRGINNFDESGSSVSNAGDINGDGLSDILIGATRSDINGLDSGQSYIIFGSTNPQNNVLSLSELNGNNGFVINGVDTGDRSGFSVSNAGDINGDGLEDIIIGARDADSNNDLDTGETYIVFGSQTIGNSGTVELAELNGNNGFVIRGIERGDRLGVSVSSAGDINGDGIEDIVIGTQDINLDNGSYLGETYVIFGDEEIGNSGEILLSELDGENGFILKQSSIADSVALIVSEAGDINGDGFDDLVVGTEDPQPETIGKTYVIFGSDRVGNEGQIDFSELDGSNGFEINGVEENDRSGSAVSNGGDINGDGFDDLIIGARYAEVYGNSFAGKTYVILGGLNIGVNGNLNLADLNGSNGFAINGINDDDLSGSDISYGGDFNDDGFDDLIIGAPSADLGDKNDVGEAYIIYGAEDIGNKGNIDISALNRRTGLIIEGENIGDRLGVAVSNIEDFNGDGVSDIIVGGFGVDFEDLNNVGASYILFGGSNSIIEGTEGEDRIEGTPNSEEINGLQGDDTLIGKAGEDLIDGGNGNDILFGNSEEDTLIGGNDNDTLFGQLGNDSLSGGDGNDSLEGNEGLDTLSGGVGDDTLLGNLGDDLLEGGSGNDSILGGEGEDTLLGLSGDDTLIGENNNDLIDGGLGNDSLSGKNGFDILMGGLGNDTLTGGNGDDFLEGGEDNDSIVGGLGTDTLFGGLGQDTLIGGNGEDLFQLRRGENGDEDIILDYLDGVDKFQLVGGLTFSKLVIVQSSDGFDAEVRIRATNDLIALIRETSIEKLNQLDFFSGDDLIGSSQNDTLLGNETDNFINGQFGDDSLEGNVGNDILQGRSGRDTIVGGVGEDSLFGGSNNDLLIGGSDRDRLTGGTGSDRFFYPNIHPVDDIITDFTPGEDTILISANGFGVELSEGVLSNDIFVIGNNAQTEGDRFIYNPNNNQLSFDIDGNGSIAPIVIATLNNNVDLSNEDIVIAN